MLRKLSCKRRDSEQEDIFDVPTQQRDETPARRLNGSEDEESPYYLCSTQEVNDEIDVLWDWNSPQSKQKPKKERKRITFTNSPKVPFKRHLSNNNQHKQGFDVLKEQLEALKEELAKPDHEESLVLSPHEEAVYKSEEEANCSALDELMQQNRQEPCDRDLEDIFNDSVDDKLIEFSQRIENELLKGEVEPSMFCDNKFSETSVSNLNNNYEKNYINSHSRFVWKDDKESVKVEETVFDDSLDIVMSQMPIDGFDELTQVVDLESCNADYSNKTNKKTVLFPRSVSENSFSKQNKAITGKVEFHRTLSFEISNGFLSQAQRKGIERKKLEAEEKLKQKRKDFISNSPIKCSPDEIEQKRLDALAKREAKKQQEIIERKKQEALKRLAATRRRNAATIKTALYKKL